MAIEADNLLEPKDCALLLVDQQAGLAFGVGSTDRQMLLNNVNRTRAHRSRLWRTDHCVDLGHKSLQRSSDACHSGCNSRCRRD